MGQEGLGGGVGCRKGWGGGRGDIIHWSRLVDNAAVFCVNTWELGLPVTIQRGGASHPVEERLGFTPLNKVSTTKS